jgi:hypothetical protein
MLVKKIEDDSYFTLREKLKKLTFTVDDLDHYPLFVGAHNMARNFFVVQEFLKTLDVPGNIYEFGMWRGSTAFLLSKFLLLSRPQQNKVIVGFDNFSGLPHPSVDDGEEAQSYVGRYKGDLEFLRSMIISSNFNDIITVVDGDANQTIPSFFEDNPYDLVSFALLDFDLYDPTMVAIHHIVDRVPIGGKIMFDEGTSQIWQGEKKAMQEFLKIVKSLQQAWQPLENPITRQPTTVFTRIQ